MEPRPGSLPCAPCGYYYKNICSFLQLFLSAKTAKGRISPLNSYVAKKKRLKTLVCLQTTVDRGQLSPLLLEYYYHSEEKVNEKLDAEYSYAVANKNTNKTKQMVVEAADRAIPDSLIREGFAVNSSEHEDGELVPVFHGSGTANFNVFNIPDYEGALGKGAYFTSIFEDACDYAI